MSLYYFVQLIVPSRENCTLSNIKHPVPITVSSQLKNQLPSYCLALCVHLQKVQNFGPVTSPQLHCAVLQCVHQARAQIVYLFPHSHLSTRKVSHYSTYMCPLHNTGLDDQGSTGCVQLTWCSIDMVFNLHDLNVGVFNKQGVESVGCSMCII